MVHKVNILLNKMCGILYVINDLFNRLLENANWDIEVALKYFTDFIDRGFLKIGDFNF